MTISDGAMPCPVPSPTGLPCTKKIPAGWSADEEHLPAGCWMGCPKTLIAFILFPRSGKKDNSGVVATPAIAPSVGAKYPHDGH